MLKTVHIPSKIATFLIATLLMVISLKTALLADGSPILFSSDALKDPGSLAVKLQDTRASLSKSLRSQLSAKTQQLLTEYNGTSFPSSALQKELLADLNRLIQEGSLYDDQHFASIPLSEQTQKLLAQNPENGENLIRLNRFLLADAYPQELASPAEKQSSEDSKGIETCRANLRQIKLALENYRAKTGTEPQWLSELSPEYLEKKALLCPADATQGKPGVLTEGAEDPTLPCSYLYEFRPEQKRNQEILLGIVGNMLSIVRCQHHSLNLSISGKLYRNGPQGDIYNSVSNVNITGEPEQKMFYIRSAEDLAALREHLGDAYFETEDGKALLKHFAKQSDTFKKTEAEKLIGSLIPDIAFRNLSGEPVKLKQFRGNFVLLNLFSTDSISCGPDLQRLEKHLKNIDAARLQAIGISTDNPVKAITEFKEKYQISMPLWVDEKSEILRFLNNDTAQLETKLITILLNSELVVEAVFTDMEALLKKVTELIEAKE